MNIASDASDRLDVEHGLDARRTRGRVTHERRQALAARELLLRAVLGPVPFECLLAIHLTKKRGDGHPVARRVANGGETDRVELAERLGHVVLWDVRRLYHLVQR